MKSSKILIAVLLAVSSLTTLLAAARHKYVGTIAQQTLSVPGVTVDISILNAGESSEAKFLLVDFSANAPNISVGCLNAFLDLKYSLRDAITGQIVAADTQAWKKYPDVVTNYDANACAPGITISEKHTRVLLPQLYPGLHHGRYVLQIQLAPRGSQHRVFGAPITIQA